MSATGSRSLVKYITESSWGVGSPIGTVGSPLGEMAALPYVSFGLNLSKDIYQDDTIRSDRRRQFNVHGNRSVAGDLVVNLASGSFDAFIASALNSNWALGSPASPNSISDGVTPLSFTIEQSQLDIAQHRVFTGVKVNTWALDVPVNGIVTSTFGLIGKDMQINAVAADSSVADPTVERPFFHAGGSFSVDGDATCRLSALSLNVDNESQPNFCLGSDTPRDITFGFTTITGSATVYFDNADYFNNFLNQTTAAVTFTLTDGTNTLTVTLPKVKYDGTGTSIEGQGPVLLDVPFSAFSDSGAAIIQVDRA